MSYQGMTYFAPNGRWSWAITKNDIVMQAGAGYESEDEARMTMEDELASQQEADRAHQVRQMITNSRLEGIDPSETDKELHQAYIAGTATLSDLHNHAIAFALEQHAIEHSPSNSSSAQEMLAAGHWVTYYDDYLVPDVILREWPDGRMEIVDSDEKGNVLVVQELPNKSELRKRRDAIRSALGDAQMSGGYPSKKVKDLAEMYAIGRITLEEFLNAQRHEPGS